MKKLFRNYIHIMFQYYFCHTFPFRQLLLGTKKCRLANIDSFFMQDPGFIASCFAGISCVRVSEKTGRLPLLNVYWRNR